jgi:hypothetical protein
MPTHIRVDGSTGVRVKWPGTLRQSRSRVPRCGIHRPLAQARLAVSWDSVADRWWLALAKRVYSPIESYPRSSRAECIRISMKRRAEEAQAPFTTFWLAPRLFSNQVKPERSREAQRGASLDAARQCKLSQMHLFDQKDHFRLKSFKPGTSHMISQMHLFDLKTGPKYKMT